MTKEQDFEIFLDFLNDACKNMNDPHYFQIEEAGSDELKYRERVYCYELYHQLRCELTDEYYYKLDGELDKAGHPIIKEGFKPDFVVQKPKRMDENLVVIEVKPINGKPSSIIDDMKKLKDFIDKYGYHGGIMLIYGENSDTYQLADTIAQIRSDLGEYPNTIKVLVHPGPGKEFTKI
jgi:hypothetical protein